MNARLRALKRLYPSKGYGTAMKKWVDRFNGGSWRISDLHVGEGSYVQRDEALWSDPYLSGPSLLLPNADGAYASTPSSAGLAIAGDIDVRVGLQMDDWSPSGVDFDHAWLIGRYGSSTTRQWGLLLNTSNKALVWAWSANGSTQLTLTSTAAIPFEDGEYGEIRVAFDADNGASGRTATFYTRRRGGEWTQLGNPATSAGATSIYASGTPALAIGVLQEGGYTTEHWPGRFSWAEVRSGINGSVVASPRFHEQSSGDTTFTDDQGNTWTVNGAASISAT